MDGEKLSTIGVTTGLAILGFFTLTAAFNGCQGTREFDTVDAKVRMLTEEGKLTNEKDGTPIPYIVKFDNGAEYAVTVGKALNQQNGQFRNGSGQVVEGTQNNNGGIQSSSVQSQDYLLNGTISRIKGSDGALRIWFNYGAERGFSKDWITRPTKAPLSVGQSDKQYTVPVTTLPAPVSVPAAPAQ